MKEETTYERLRNHPSLVERIVDELKGKIAGGHLKPGQRVVENELCRKMEISRSPLREAFRILESQGFLVREPRRGMRVAAFTLEEAEEIYLIRALLESLAARLAVKRSDPAVLKELKKLHRGMVKAAADRDMGTYRRLNLGFHETLTEASGSRRLADLVHAFITQTNRYRFQVLGLPGKIEDSLRNHAELIRLFENGEAEEAERSRREAILRNIDILRRHCREENHEN